MGLDNGARNRQAETETLTVTFLSLFELMKRMKDALFVRILDARARVGNSYQRESPRWLCACDARSR